MSYRLPNPASLTHDERMQYRAAQVGSRYNGSTPETLADGSAIYTAADGSRFYLQAFAGKAVVPSRIWLLPERREPERRHRAVQAVAGQPSCGPSATPPGRNTPTYAPGWRRVEHQLGL
ncbi:hypothetical protein [Xanthomonas phaseoli]|uniref:hypothetical protein n=1 Tax=Xanthomonas phaseoli TaxID=1985254 RepID=UPI00135F1A37|nr:hypothetical protein [Xanthomonas phaseoli]